MTVTEVIVVKLTKIHTASYVRKDGEPVRLDSLPEETRQKIATQLMITYMNELYRGQAEFFTAEEAAKDKECCDSCSDASVVGG